jgi:two-component system alkaline phosphatase synthesis response regulator PhoP
MAKILIIDDEPDIRDLLAYNLVKNGFEVVEGQNGLEAVALVPQEAPDLVIMDLMMPQMDGITACKEIRSLPLQYQPFIVFLTARSQLYASQATRDAGANDYVLKPLRPDHLVSRIRQWLA